MISIPGHSGGQICSWKTAGPRKISGWTGARIPRHAGGVQEADRFLATDAVLRVPSLATNAMPVEGPNALHAMERDEGNVGPVEAKGTRKKGMATTVEPSPALRAREAQIPARPVIHQDQLPAANATDARG